MLSLRIVRGPLKDFEEKAILREFNRLTNSAIADEDFRRWIRDSPDGPAWHAILETDESQIVGHFCLIPLHAQYDGKRLYAARTEYLFVHEDYRRDKVCGFENSFMSCGLLLLDRLYQNCLAQGWDPLIVSASEGIQPLHKAVGCRPADFGLSECLLILRPWGAARGTPNLSSKQRIALFFAGLAQRAYWFFASIVLRKPRGITFTSADGVCVHPTKGRTAFFGDKPSVNWRYPDGQYTTLVSEDDPHQYIIAKRGSDQRYLRVCQWELGDGSNHLPFLLALISQARQERALGVRWSLYGDQQQPEMLNVMRKLGFLCVQRSRRLLFYTGVDTFLKPEEWSITDSFFSFDL